MFIVVSLLQKTSPVPENSWLLSASVFFSFAKPTYEQLLLHLIKCKYKNVKVKKKKIS